MSDGNGATLGSLIGIVLAGGSGAVLAWWIVAALGIAGVAGALLTVLIAMFLALGLFALGVVVLNAITRRS